MKHRMLALLALAGAIGLAVLLGRKGPPATAAVIEPRETADSGIERSTRERSGEREVTSLPFAVEPGSTASPRIELR